MTTQNYFLINQQNVVQNIVVWDGNTETWNPPEGYTMLLVSTTPAMIWQLNGNVSPNIYELVEVVGAGNIGFTWDGKVLTTNDPQPTI